MLTSKRGTTATYYFFIWGEQHNKKLKEFSFGKGILSTLPFFCTWNV